MPEALIGIALTAGIMMVCIGVLVFLIYWDSEEANDDRYDPPFSF